MTATTIPVGREAPEVATNVLLQALPYIQQFRGKIVVVKYGGNAMTSPELAAGFAADIVLMHSVGMLPVVVHGGGPQISELMAKLGKQPTFVDGLRVTDAESLEITRMVLVGRVNREVVGEINRHGPLAVGVSGEDAGLITATPRDEKLGFVGDVDSVNPDLVERLLAQGLIPVVSTTGVGVDGQAYNINADTVAGALAAALTAEKVVYLTDIEGLRHDVDDPESLVRRTSVANLRDMVAAGSIGTGMIPKVDGCMAAVEAGVRSAHMVDGTRPHVLLLEIFTDAGIGTMVTVHDPATPAGTAGVAPTGGGSA